MMCFVGNVLCVLCDVCVSCVCINCCMCCVLLYDIYIYMPIGVWCVCAMFKCVVCVVWFVCCVLRALFLLDVLYVPYVL